MSRMHSGNRGASRSKRPTRESAPEWQGLEKGEIEEMIVKLAREGKTAAFIGLVLRDQYAVPDVKVATGKKMSEILAANQLAPAIPEDLQNLMKRAVHLQGHLKTHPKDNHNARGQQLIESKIRRLARFYKEEGKLPADWRYTADTAQLAVE
ncbi:MAG: 30S ribosomal protein S15 [Thermoplasmatota archaeon]